MFMSLIFFSNSKNILDYKMISDPKNVCEFAKNVCEFKNIIGKFKKRSWVSQKVLRI